MISIEVAGKKYIGFKNCKVEVDMESACRSFSFVSTSEQKIQTPIKVNDKVGIWIDKNKVITGYVDEMTPDWEEANHTIDIKGRSITSDIIDSSTTGNMDMIAPISLVNIFKRVLSELGITNINVLLNNKLKSFNDEELKGKQDNELGEVVASPVAQNAFEFLEKFCKKRQVFFTSDGNGNIVLARASDTTLPISLIHKVNGQNNNVKRAKCNFDNSKRFYKYIVRSQTNNIDDIDAGFESQVGTAYDKDIRKTRVLELQAEVASDIQTSQDRATWEANIRRARSFVYTCTVSGFYIDAKHSKIWDINTLVPVIDEYEDINATLLIKKVSFNLDENGTETTELELVSRDAMTLQASENSQLSNLTKQGKALKETVSKNRGV